MNPATKRTLSRAMTAEPAPMLSGEFTLPTKTDLDAARARSEDLKRKSGEVPAGRVLGLDYDEWASAIVNLDSTADRIADTRRALERKGYTKLPGEPIVAGYPNPEVWVKTRAQWLADREARRERIRQEIHRGMMSDTALGAAVVHDRYGQHTAD